MHSFCDSAAMRARAAIVNRGKWICYFLVLVPRITEAFLLESLQCGNGGFGDDGEG